MKNPVIRTIYLYLFSLVGLGMLVIGTSMIINLGLKAWVFTQADKQDGFIERPMPIAVDRDFENVKNLQACADKCDLTETQKEQIGMWLEDYEDWRKNGKNVDSDVFVTRNRHRQASTAVSLIIIGLPLWLFHWRQIKKDVRSV